MFERIENQVGLHKSLYVIYTVSGYLASIEDDVTLKNIYEGEIEPTVEGALESLERALDGI